MALVVAARTPVRAYGANPGALRALAIASTVSFVLALGTDAAARAVPTTGWLDTATLLTSILAAGLILLVSVAAWLARRSDSTLLLAATLAPVLIVLRSVLVALLTSLESSTLADVADVSLSLVTLCAMTWTTTTWIVGTAPEGRPVRVETEFFRRVVEITSFVLVTVGLSGAMVSAVGASWACQGVFPDCNGQGALPFGRDPLTDIQLYHRLLAYVAFGLVLWITIEAFRSQRGIRGLVPVALALVLSSTLDAVVGALSVSLSVPPLLEVAHSLTAAGTLSSAVAMVAIAHRGAIADSRPAARVYGRTLAAYVQLTKPRVMSLLLATTAAAMLIAARGLPDLGLFIATLVGGALMSGGAGAINHYVDRDIDPLMGRTAWRPIPSGVIAPSHALWFGIALALLASVVFALFVNLLAMLLALLGLLGYVFIYTLWLKRSTPSNIVIGGAAGAIPPLVGWAAVTNEIGSLTAWYLFAIIFFWTPPHFWALSLLIRQHYERAGVPMLPVVRGEDETRRQIVLYSLLLVVLTLVLSPFGMMGTIYFVSAAALGAVFVVDAFRLLREASREAARRLYLYSILYLFALFAAMAVDRIVLR